MEEPAVGSLVPLLNALSKEGERHEVRDGQGRRETLLSETGFATAESKQLAHSTLLIRHGQDQEFWERLVEQ